MKKSVGDKAATGRTLSCRAKRDRTMSAVPRPPSALAQGRLSRKAREGAHPQLFGQMLKDKPVFYFPNKVAHAPAVTAERRKFLLNSPWRPRISAERRDVSTGVTYEEQVSEAVRTAISAIGVRWVLCISTGEKTT